MMMEDLETVADIAPLRIRKSIKTRARTDSSSTTPELTSSSSASSVSSTSSLPPIQAAPSPTLIQARRVHRARHDSWVIASRVVERAEDVFETCLWASKDVEEAQIRLRIARDEELACRRRVDDAALQILLIKRKDSTASNGGHPLQRRGTGVKNANADAESTLSPAEQPLKTPRTPKITIDFSSIATGMTEGGDGMVDGECRCQAPCLCSAVSSLFG